MADWKPIPGYVGVYWMNKRKQVRNAKGTILTPKEDGTVELRNNGTREQCSVELLHISTFQEGGDEH